MKSKKSIFLCLLLLTSCFPKENKYFVAFGDEIFSSVMKLISEEKNIYFGVYSHENVKYISDNIIKNLQAVREKPEIEIKATPT